LPAGGLFYLALSSFWRQEIRAEYGIFVDYHN
jgi:hypothetical protein